MSERNFKCHNCGNCCGPVPINSQERARIQNFLKTHPEIDKYAKQKYISVDCVFRDEKSKKCLIYECRPKICKLFQCCNNNWQSSIRIPKSSKAEDFLLINECFGAAMFKEAYSIFRMQVFSNPLTI